jgi:hypothetical protein
MKRFILRLLPLILFFFFYSNASAGAGNLLLLKRAAGKPTLQSSGSVSQANMRMSIVNGGTTSSGGAFVDFSSAGALTVYSGSRLIITSGNNSLTGYIKAAGTGETYGSDLLKNGSAEGTYTDGVAPNWTKYRGTASEDNTPNGGLSAQKISNPAGNTGYIVTLWTSSLTSGWLLSVSLYFKTYAGSGGAYGIDDAGWAYVQLGAVNNALWTQSTSKWTVTGTGWASFNLYSNSNASADVNQISYDDVLVTQVLTPSATGVTITSTKNGSLYNWTSEASGFNRNSSTGYTYQIWNY